MSATRARLLAKHQAELDQWHLEQAGQPVLSEDEYDTLQRVQWLEGARSYDPGANLAEEFVLRLRGEAAEAGGLDLSVGGALLKPLHEMVAAAAERDVKLLLVGVSPGSTVLHFRPQDEVPAAVDGDQSQLPVESAVRKIIELVDAAEAGTRSEVWGETEKGLGHLARVLDNFDLTADFRWMDSAGGVKSSSLTERGRANVLTWHAPVPLAEPFQMGISGRITELKGDSGEAKVKTGASRKSKAYTVHFEPGQLISLHLTLGTSVAFTVEERTRITRGGDVVSEYHFVSWDNPPSE
ncbi:hypothetical protein PUR61_44910 [Streptomyces sp. BE20]|uniref:hypothetical protein n=1 Tax=Streptomyces sp. BE20 TaxID=3002525 RepID=UPI002E78A403|nr:hypothetical protein [Streptomyces sp. BE20]MEE1829258.1 hypothetical protein [Streptomyces sp. BE20]